MILDQFISYMRTSLLLKMSLEAQKLMFSMFLIIFAVKYTACLDESCYLYRRSVNVTIDTDQCLWENYTEPKTKRFCLESCFNNDTVRTDDMFRVQYNATVTAESNVIVSFTLFPWY